MWGVEDIHDIGKGEPLYGNFQREDWVVLQVRCELHLLVHAFPKDAKDPDRSGIPEQHLGFYYNKYFKKTFSPHAYAAKDLAGVIEHISDAVQVSAKTKCIEGQLSEDTPITNFVKLTEEARRDRQRRVDAGDESAKLKFPVTTQLPQTGKAGAPKGNGKGSGKGPVPPSGPPGAARPAAAGASAFRAPLGHARPAPAYQPAAKRPRPAGAPGFGANVW